MQQLNTDLITLDPRMQPRVTIDDTIVADYAAGFTQNALFPPVTVFRDGEKYWLADGFHRVIAAKQAGRETILADVKEGTERDAILYSVGANANHGLRRTNQDKYRAVETLLRDPEWSHWSDRQIADKCRVHHDTVSRMRVSLADSDSDGVRTYVTKHGSVSTMKTAGINEGRPPRARSGGNSPRPMLPTRSASLPTPHTALDLPHNAPSAARALMSAFDRQFVEELVQQLTLCLEGGNNE